MESWPGLVCLSFCKYAKDTGCGECPVVFPAKVTYEVLVLELLAIDGLATSAVASSEVTTLHEESMSSFIQQLVHHAPPAMQLSDLEHEVGNHAVEARVLEVEGLAGLASALLA